jgi:predicted MFS family arabinose efflux permease
MAVIANEVEGRRVPASLWRNPDYLLLWWGQALSSVGTEAALLALPLLILAVTHSPAEAGVLGALRGFAYIVFGLPAGALVDRWNRRWVMILCDSGRAIAFASIPLTLWLGHLSAAQLYAVTFFEGFAFIFFGLAETACLTRVVTQRQVPLAIAQSQATDSTAMLLGPPLGGALYGVWQALPFLANAVSFAVSVVTVLFIRAPLQGARPEQPVPMRAQIAEGLRWTLRQRALRLLWLLNTGINIVFGGWPLIVIVLAQRHGASSGQIGLIFAAGGGATIVGSLLSPVVQRRFPVGRIMMAIVWLFALTWLPYAFVTKILWIGVANAVGFLFVPISGGTMFAYRLLLVPDALQGRVNSVFRLGGFGGQTLGFLIAGLLLQAYGPVATVWITFVPSIGLALLPTLSPSLRGVGMLHDVTTIA